MFNYSVLYKTKNIFEQVTGKCIVLRFVNIDLPAVNIKNKNAEILLPVQNQEEWNFYYRNFEHELSHIVFNSPDPYVVTKRILRKCGLPQEYKLFVKTLLNIIEDYRVDWLWNQFYHGSKIVREEQLKTAAEELIQSSHIIDILNAVRCDPETVNKINDPELRKVCRKFLKILKKVEGKSWKASVVATIRTLKLIEKYLIQQQELQPQLQPQLQPFAVTVVVQQQKQEERQTEQEGQEEEEPEDRNQELSTIINSEVFENLDVASKLTAEPFTCSEQIENSTISEDEINKILDRTVEEVEREAEKEGQKLIKEVEKKLKRTLKVNPKKLEHKNIYGKISKKISLCDQSHSKPDNALAVKITKALNTIKNKQRVSNDVVGLEIDIDEVIKHKITKNGEPFETEETETGFDIVVLLDASSSMKKWGKMNIASSACATLFLALQKVKNVNMKVVAFNCDETGREIKLKELKTVDEICRVSPKDYTPTWAAVHYAVNILNRSTAQKKMIVLVTDGLPEIETHSLDTTFAWTRSAIQRARRSGIDVYTLFIDTDVDSETLRKVFGPEWTWEKVEDIKQLPKRLFNLVVNKIVRR